MSMEFRIHCTALVTMVTFFSIADQLIPANSNVYYALSSELHPTLVISRKTS